MQAKMEENSSCVVDLQVIDEEQWEIMQDESENWGKHSIYKLPACVTDLNKNDAYKPRAVSFGPHHHGDPKLKPMEAHKRRVVRRLIERWGKSMDDYMVVLEAVSKDLMDAYESLEPKWKNDSKAFLQLMIRDGCFMLEILRYCNGAGACGYVANDPIFSDHGKLYMIPYIRRDMLMLENQLPMLLLTKLLSVEDQHEKEICKDDEYINRLVSKFCSLGDPPKQMGKCFHVLDVYRKRLLGDENRKAGMAGSSDAAITESQGSDILPSATQLSEAGITIIKSGTGSIKDIHFKAGCLGGRLEIPQILVDDTTESVFLNLIAYERFHVGIGNEVTSYISFMDDIIDNQRDVSLLQSCDIVENAYGSDKAVANLFNSLSKDITLDPESTLLTVRSNAKRHCKRWLNRCWGNLIHTYFRNPWTLISLIAAILLFGLTIIQTIYTMKQYFQQINSPSA